MGGGNNFFGIDRRVVVLEASFKGFWVEQWEQMYQVKVTMRQIQAALSGLITLSENKRRPEVAAVHTGGLARGAHVARHNQCRP